MVIGENKIKAYCLSFFSHFIDFVSSVHVY